MGKAIWEPYGNYMGPVREKSTHIYLPEKKKKKKKKKKQQTFTHFYTNDYKSPVPADFWTGKVPTGRDLRTCASYCTCVESRGLKDIGVL